MERKYSFFQAPFLAFSSSDLYRDVADNWTGSGALYIFLLSSVAWLISCLALFAPVMQAINNQDLMAAYNQIPGIVIENGKMTLDRPCPYDIKDKAGVPFMRLATDRQKEKMIAGDPSVVFTQTAMLVSEKTMRESRSGYKLASYEDAKYNGDKDAEPAKVVLRYTKINEIAPRFELSGKTVQTGLEKVMLCLPIGLLIVGWPFVFLGHLMQLLVFGGIAALAASMLQREMKFEKAMRLAAIAMTPGIIISTLLSSTHFIAPPLSVLYSNWWVASVALAIVYIVTIVRSLPESQIAR